MKLRIFSLILILILIGFGVANAQISVNCTGDIPGTLTCIEATVILPTPTPTPVTPTPIPTIEPTIVPTPIPSSSSTAVPTPSPTPVALNCTTNITPSSSISTSVNALSGGSTVCLGKGAYNQSVSITKSGSASAGYIRITCATGNAADCIVSQSTNTSGDDVFFINANYIEIDHLTITGGNWGVLATNGANHPYIHDNIVSSAGCEGIAGICNDYDDFEHNTVTQSAKTASNSCSGMTVYEPVASDTLSGTHIYFGYNITYANGNPSGGTDGEGMSFDDFSHSQGYCTKTPYTQQALAEENISYANQGPGFTVGYSSTTGPKPVIRNNTFMWNNTVLLDKSIYTRSELECVDCNATMVNNIEWANTALYSNDQSGNFNCTATCASGYIHTNNLDALTSSSGTTDNPLFVTDPVCTSSTCTILGNFALQSTSPAIGIGTSAYGTPTTNFIGTAITGTPNAGAY